MSDLFVCKILGNDSISPKDSFKVHKVYHKEGLVVLEKVESPSGARRLYPQFGGPYYPERATAVKKWNSLGSIGQAWDAKTS